MRRHVVIPCILSVLALLVIGAPRAAYAQQPQQEYIVQFQAGAGAAARAQAAQAAGAAMGQTFAAVNAAVVRVPNAAALAALQGNPAVLSVVPNRPVFAMQDAQAKGGRGGGGGGGGGGHGGGGGGGGQVTPLGVARVGAPAAGSDGSGVGVAILDTGVDLAHADLTGTIDAYNALAPGTTCQDGEGHGTHVAGIVGAHDNGVDVVGVAPGVQIYCVKVLDDTGAGSDATVMAGLQWVLANAGAVKVANLSLGRPGTVNDNPALRDLVTAVEAAGVLIVASAGNDPETEAWQQIPAGYPEVAAVASSTAAAGANKCKWLASPIGADTASYFTTDGSGVLISAPGEDEEDVNGGCLIKSIGILSTALGGGTTRMSGTSMAAPHVTGVAARYFEVFPGGLPAAARSWIAATAAAVGTAPLDSPTSTYSFDGVREGIVQAP